MQGEQVFCRRDLAGGMGIRADDEVFPAHAAAVIRNPNTIDAAACNFHLYF